MNKSVLAGFAVGTFISAAAVFAFQSDSFDATAHASDSETYRQLSLFGDVFERVRADYVEPTEDSKLVEYAINGMLTSLDPHSSYMTPKSFRDMQVQTRGEFGGLGIEVTMENGVVKVVTPIDDTPASRAGLRPNDYITHIDAKPILGLTLSDAVDKMRGPVNTTISLTVVRKGMDEPFDVKIVRDIITIKSVKFHREGDIGSSRRTSPYPAKTDWCLARQRLYPRLAQQSRWATRSGYQRERRLHRGRRNRLHPWSPLGRYTTI